ncbi:hypothetical protein AMTRI_Chr06g192600 [Amborella trichopoda]
MFPIRWLSSLLVIGVQFLFIQNAWSKPYEMPTNCKRLECPSYVVLHHFNEFEIRSYQGHTIWMSTKEISSNSYKEAANEGFETLFDYIQGKNNVHMKIEMTAPVLVDIVPSSSPLCNSTFAVKFYVPKKHQKKPPVSSQVEPEQWPGNQYVAARRFGGFMNDSNVAMDLKESLEKSPWASRTSLKRRKGSSEFTVAGYDSPYEYDNRVNEVMIFLNDY